jgi:A/G-specific adenine glycosylase
MAKTGLEGLLIQTVRARKPVIQRYLVKWGKEHFRHFPWREHRTAYSILIAEVLLKRTTASAVKNVFKDFMSLYQNLTKIAQADCKKLEDFLSKLGYHKLRAKILIEIADYIIKEYSGEIPRTKEELLNVPYIGDYTANAILSLAYGIPSAMVDCNIIRILTRVFLKHLPEKPSQKIIQKVADLLSPIKDNQCYNYALLDLGALVCRSGIPKCKLCPINGFCDYYLSDNPHSDD